MRSLALLGILLATGAAASAPADPAERRRQALADFEDPAKRKAAATELENLYAVPDLIPLLRHPDAEARAAAAKALRGGAALSYAIYEVAGDDRGAQDYASEKLRTMSVARPDGARAELPGLLAILSDRSKTKEARSKAAADLRALADAEKQAAVDALLYALSDPEIRVRREAAQAIMIAGPGQRPEETFARGFKALARAPWRRRADYAASAPGTHAALLALEDRDARVRAAAAGTLEKRAGEDELIALEDAANDPDPGARRAVRSALDATRARLKAKEDAKKAKASR